MHMSDFDVFENKWEITGKITMVTSLRIGGGQNTCLFTFKYTRVAIP